MFGAREAKKIAEHVGSRDAKQVCFDPDPPSSTSLVKKAFPRFVTEISIIVEAGAPLMMIKS